MSQIGTRARDKAAALLVNNGALQDSVNDVAGQLQWPAPVIGDRQIGAHNIAADLAEKTVGARYPAVTVYCEKLTNSLREKFRTFSGTARVAMEARVSSDRLDTVDGDLALLVDAITGVLDANRGDWGEGFFYTGGYEVAFAPAKHGGRNFLQTAKVTFELHVSQ